MVLELPITLRLPVTVRLLFRVKSGANTPPVSVPVTSLAAVMVLSVI